MTAGVGLSLGGHLTTAGNRHELGAGGAGFFGAGYRLVAGEGWLPFVILGATGSGSSVPTKHQPSGAEAQLSTFDLRGGLTVGEVFANAFAPYLTVRAFGGPVLWDDRGASRQGTDEHHYQLGGGALVTTGWLDAFFELIPLGERAATFGAALSF